MSPETAAATQAALNQGINVVSQISVDRKNRKYAEKMYKRQRADALADWNMQNAYNTPQAQMERFKAAGLNPNLIYGNQSDVGAVRSTQMDVPEAKAPQVHGNAISEYMDASLKQVQTNNLAAQAQIIEEQRKLLQAQTLNTLMAADQKSLSNDKIRALWDNMMDTAHESLESRKIRNTLDWQTFGQKAEMFPNLLAEKIADINRTISGTDLNRAQLGKIAQDIRQSKAITALTENKNLSETQHRKLVDSIMQSNVIKMKLGGQEYNRNNLEYSIREIQKENKELRISDQALENGVKEILDLIPSKKIMKIDKKQENTYEKIKN